MVGDKSALVQVLAVSRQQAIALTKVEHNSSRHYNDVIMSAMASQITGVSTVCSSVGSGTDKRKHQSSSSLAFVLGIHR